jgi:hypothetical protein
MVFWILAIVFVVTCKAHKYELLFYNILVLCIWKFGMLHDWCFKNWKCIEWVEHDFIIKVVIVDLFIYLVVNVKTIKCQCSQTYTYKSKFHS